MSISLVHRIHIGKRGGPEPVISDIDWNPQPSNCSGKNANAMIATLSNLGTHIFYLAKATKKWTSMVIKYRPWREGPQLHWHSEGTALATSCNSIENVPAHISVLCYSEDLLKFVNCATYEISKGLEVSSLTWLEDDLAVALCPTAQILFYKFHPASKKLDFSYESKCHEFPEGSKILLHAHPLGNIFFSCCPESSKILVWTDVPTSTWMVTQSIDLGVGQFLYGMSFCEGSGGLFGNVKECDWRYFHFDRNLYTLVQKDKMEKALYGIGEKESKLLALAASRKSNLFATVGDNILRVYRTALSGDRAVEWEVLLTKDHDICYGEVNCVKFNPKDVAMLRIATAGKGFVHFWAVHKEKRGELSPRRKHETFFYKKAESDDDYVNKAERRKHETFFYKKAESDDDYVNKAERVVEYEETETEDDEDAPKHDEDSPEHDEDSEGLE